MGRIDLVKTTSAIPSLVQKYSSILICPACGGSFDTSHDRGALECLSCNHSFPLDGGIPLLFWENNWHSKKDVTEIVKSFYEETPFPNYEGTDSIASLQQKAEKGVFARLLDDQVPPGTMILEAGCGTGQLSNFLAIQEARKIFATDMCLNSLKLGQNFKEQNGLNNIAFLQMNLFKPVFKPESFHLVISNGVMHHTADPFLAFQTLAKLVKKGGFIIIGLYNTYGRIPNDLRGLLYRFLDTPFFRSFDPRLRAKNVGATRKHTWFMDQYKHPHESKHTLGEVLQWFDQCGFDFVNGIPKLAGLEPFSPQEKLFQRSPAGNAFDHFLVQMNLLLTGGSEGGFFIMIGQKRG